MLIPGISWAEIYSKVVIYGLAAFIRLALLQPSVLDVSVLQNPNKRFNFQPTSRALGVICRRATRCKRSQRMDNGSRQSRPV